MKNRFSSTVIVWIFLVIVLAGITLAFFYQTFVQRQSDTSSPDLPYLGDTGSFKLVTSDGKVIDQDHFENTFWVADFIFTRCRGQCPFMVEKMKELESKFRNHEDLKFVSVSVDPGTDTPDILAAYKRQHGIVSDQWLFLTSDKNTIYELVKSNFKLGVEEGGDFNEPIIHSNRFVLVDKQGMIRGYYSAASTEDFAALEKDLSALLK